MKKLFLVLFGITLFFSACKSEKAGTEKDTIVYSHPANAGPLNPHDYGANQMYAQALVYDPLVALRNDGSIGPALAERWDISPDGKEYTFFLRSGVTFTDGQPFNADAVVKNFKTVMENAARHDWLGIISKIEKFEAPSPLEFKLTLNAPYYPCLDDLALVRPFRFLSPAAFPDTGDTRNGIKYVAGTGQWKLSETKLGEYDVFERNESYWGDIAKAKKLLVKVIPDPVTRALAFENGEIDLIYGMGQINFDTFNRLKNSPGASANISGPMGTVTLALNTAKGPTEDRAVRWAIQHMADKDSIIRGVTLNTQLKAESYFAPTVPYCDVGLEPYGFDPEKATALLEEAGWKLENGKRIREKNGIPLSIDFCFVGNNAAQKAIAEVLQGQALNVGIALNLLGEESDSFYRRQNDGDFGMIFNDTWGPPYEPHAMVSSMLVPSHADFAAQSGLPMKAELHSQINQVMDSVNQTDRRELYRKILTTLHDEAVYLPVYYLTILEVHRTDSLRNVQFGPSTSEIPFNIYQPE